MTDLSPEQEEAALSAALARWRDGQFSALFVIALQLAAHSHPEELRKALASVYDQKATEKYLRHIDSQSKAAADYANQCCELCQQVSQQVTDLEERLDRVNDYLERLRDKARPLNGAVQPQPKVKQ